MSWIRVNQEMAVCQAAVAKESAELDGMATADLAQVHIWPTIGNDTALYWRVWLTLPRSTTLR